MTIQELHENTIDLCSRLIQAKSYSGEEREVVGVIEREMRRLGYDEVTVDEYGNVIGCLRGRRPGPRVLLDGHIDTVPVQEPERWSFDPFGGEIRDDRVCGRGASDMKGAVAAMICAAAAYAQECDHDFPGEIYVAGVVYEELYEGVSARRISQFVHPDYVIIGEASNLNLKIGQRGRAEIVLETIGKPAHSANPEKGVNAVKKMMKLLAALEDYVPEEQPELGKGIMELTDIISAPYPGASVVPAKCRATFDRRTLVGEDEAVILAQVNEAITRAREKNPGLKARCYLAAGEEKCWTGDTIRAKRYFPAWAVDEHSELVTKARRGLLAAGIDAPLSHFSFCTNGSHFCGEAGIPTIGYGPSLESLAHVRDEYIEISQLTKACRGFASILAELTR